jgi:predicted lipid-binding transport protein (Tim44 family)
MRRLTTLALSHLLLVASPSFAALGPELDTDKQMDQYGHIFGYGCGGAVALAILLTIYYLIKGAGAESARGKKRSAFREEILDEKPQKKKPEALYLGEKVPDWKIDGRKKATKAALIFLTVSDDWFERKYLTNVVHEAVLHVKEAIEGRSTKKIKRLLTPECREELSSEVTVLINKKRLRVFGGVEITGVDMIHIAVPAATKDHSFTALVSLRSKDYIKRDNESNEVLKGDKKTYSYQEFWTFHRSKDRWLVASIRPSGDMDRVLEPKNVLSSKKWSEFAKDADVEHLREFENA